MRLGAALWGFEVNKKKSIGVTEYGTNRGSFFLEAMF
jgi:hypothetical protein